MRCFKGPFGLGLTMVDKDTGRALCVRCVRDLVNEMEWAWIGPTLMPAR